ncbi:MAG TPA: FAD-dependent oxidoreductase [Bradyrhizobium sp.]|nr:FAD-dependent oxidoreductase [Bradyrhizobium sp.]
MVQTKTYDVIVAGAGAGGMTAAAVAASQGLKVLLIEKSEFIGGTTAWSGGMVWIPANHQMQRAGLSDDLSAAETYLDRTVPEAHGADLRKTFLARGSEAIDYLEAHTEVQLQPVKIYPDYYPDLPGATAGGRVLEPVAFDGLKLGHNFERLRPPLPEFTLFGGMMVNRQDIPHLRKAGRSLRSTLRTLRLISQYALQRLRAPRGTTLHLGNALAARLYASLLSRQVEMLFGATITRLIMDDSKVSGAEITSSSGTQSITACKGVVLATGGFSHDVELRRQLFPSGAGSVSATSPAGTGDGLRLAMANGARLATDVADPAYWVPASLFKRDDGSDGVFPHTVTDRAKPGVIAVNAAGRRFANEALSYHEFVRAMLRDGNDAAGRPFHLICDRRFLWNYGLGRIQPFTRRISPFIKRGELIEANTFDELATAIGVEPAALQSTVDDYNKHARSGRDPAFGRGTTIYQRYLGDAGHAPNPCVAPIETRPFYALRIFPADLGTAVGLRTDAHARVLRIDGPPITGLYACGNDMGSIMNGNYPGPGITLGPALTFGYIAARHLAKDRSAQSATGERS